MRGTSPSINSFVSLLMGSKRIGRRGDLLYMPNLDVLSGECTKERADFPDWLIFELY